MHYIILSHRNNCYGTTILSMIVKEKYVNSNHTDINNDYNNIKICPFI